MRNLEVEVSAKYDGSLPCKRQKPYTLSRHVSKLIVITTSIFISMESDLNKIKMQLKKVNIKKMILAPLWG
jgi:hypothetical protein